MIAWTFLFRLRILLIGRIPLISPALVYHWKIVVLLFAGFVENLFIHTVTSKCFFWVLKFPWSRPELHVSAIGRDGCLDRPFALVVYCFADCGAVYQSMYFS